MRAQTPSIEQGKSGFSLAKEISNPGNSKIVFHGGLFAIAVWFFVNFAEQLDV
ncbi:hypothetical protein BJ742DRAFT_777875 [Cladochytrium replicatum]|nr:hypothetical protein BJ742DRAFT_777875 [Cladochytrium replicatum]